MTEEVANAVFDILVTYAGANESIREDFVYHQSTSVCDEYRFQGALGFGGKFRRSWGRSGERWYVDQYPEDETPESVRKIDDTNLMLASWSRFAD